MSRRRGAGRTVSRSRVLPAGLILGASLVPTPGEAVGAQPVNAVRLDPRGRERPLQLVHGDGEVLASFGPDVQPPPEVPRNLRYEIALDTGSPGGVDRPRQRSLRLPAVEPRGGAPGFPAEGRSLFEPWERRTISADRVDPVLHAATVTAAGHLRVAVGVADTAWEENLPEPLTRGGREIYPVEPGTGMYDRILEDIDPVAGRVVRRQRVQPEVVDFLSRERAYAYRLDGPGFPRIDVWRIETTPSPGRGPRRPPVGPPPRSDDRTGQGRG